MKNKFISTILNGFVVFGLKPRTIFSRLGWPGNYEHKLLKKEINRDFTRFKNIKEFYSLLPKEIENFQNTTVRILNKKVVIEDLLESNLNKKDYLRTYTLHYLGFSESLDIPEQLIRKILDSEISNQPFVESQQIFNCSLDNRLQVIVKEHTLADKYNSLKKQIEYHVDGNHVLENLISLVLVEIKLNHNFTPSLTPLIKELNRQTRNEFHWEKNLKYAKDLCLKLEIILISRNKSSYLFQIKEYEDMLLMLKLHTR